MKWKLFLISVILASCTRAYVYPVNISKAEEICKDKGGVHHIEAKPNGWGAGDDAGGMGKFVVCNTKNSSQEEDEKFELE